MRSKPYDSIRLKPYEEDMLNARIEFKATNYSQLSFPRPKSLNRWNPGYNSTRAKVKLSNSRAFHGSWLTWLSVRYRNSIWAVEGGEGEREGTRLLPSHGIQGARGGCEAECHYVTSTVRIQQTGAEIGRQRRTACKYKHAFEGDRRLSEYYVHYNFFFKR